MDPLIHGPLPPPSPAIPYDLDKSSPFEDFLQMFRSPKEFFLLFGERTEFSRWVYLKAVFGLLLFSWLNEFASGGRWISDVFQQIIFILHQPPVTYLFSDSDLSFVQAQLLASMVGVAHLKMALSPFVDLLDTAALAATTALLLPWVDSEKSKESFYSIFLSLCYVRWFFVLGVIPIIGPLICVFVVAILTIQAIRWIGRTTFIKAALVSYGVYWLVLLLMLGLCLGALVFLLFA